MPIEWTSRIRKRAASIPGGLVLLQIAEQESTLREMRRLIESRQKPVVALSGELAEELGLEVARNDTLRQLAGEVASYLVESQLGAVRSSGSRKIIDDHVFTSGTPFRLPGQSGGLSRDPLATEFLIRHLSDEALASLVEIIMAEQRRRRRS